MDYTKLTYEERQALPVIRNLIKRKPEMAALLLEDMTKEGAYSILKQAQKEISNLLALSHAMSEAAGAIALSFKEKNDVSHRENP
jgi:hypothetical protein